MSICSGLQRVDKADHSAQEGQPVRRVRLRYYGEDPDRGGADWYGSWELPRLPLAMQLDVQQEDWTGQRTTHSLIVHIPTARGKPDDAT